MREGSSRREFLAALAGLGASAMLPASLAAARTFGPRRIDTHHHFFPPDYLEPLAAWNKREGVAPGLQKPQQDWSPAQAIEMMDQSGVATGVLSISTPGVWIGDEAQARHLARMCNDYGAGMVRDHPGHFGLFAAMPMPSVDGTLAEIAYALDTLGADGIGFMTSYGDLWPGDARFAPIFAELDRRKAVAYFHPTDPNCCDKLIPGVPAALIEYPHDTSRAILSMLVSGTFARYRNIRFLFSHAGASIPVLAGRIANGLKARKDLAEIAPEGVLGEFKRLYYDTANSANPPTMAALLQLVPATQVVFGSDFPYVAIAQNVEGFEQLRLSAKARHAIQRGNAERLLPRLKQA